ncbi:Pyridine nucleotide-disulfide oxidoreductase, class-II [Penicillium griseofulvum]|uniref:Pyridine nucleotide-disulfide oxidoreductase, class-II n=1 Tax=Penicillium patulum TaxID=5078 RepID=A0A135L942_PENPA|nr:Pyridine nucleotide-disulfide oxidoreductase, class-II [Penicillium griseofulvum]KXG45485.1 Pyridine nucleotide-disulfide oxidoreductase, class-II [Penicillium griseofulvum]
MLLTWNWKKLFAVQALLTLVWAQAPQQDYDVIVIGGGPSGLSAASGLSRVLRKVALFDSGEYRNNPTRHMHDVIGSDHVVPAEFRAAARKQISFYNMTTFFDQKVISIQKVENSFHATTANGTYTARKVILASGVKDDLPNVPGLREAFGKGVFWCPWCDGFEHRDQKMGVLGDFSDAYDSVKELYPTLNKDIRIYANGTNNNPAQINRINSKNIDWQKVFNKYNITVNPKPILNITRTQNGGDVHDSTRKEFDKFLVYFTDGSYEERDAFMVNYGASQASQLPYQLGVGFLGKKINTTAPGLRTTIPGVWGVGDANSDNSTNVPHAMASGKKAAVFCHVEMATEELAQVSATQAKRAAMLDDRSVHERAARQMGDEVGKVYRRLAHF